MNFVKRARARLARYPGKSLLLTGLLFVICTMVLSGLLIQSAARRASAGTKASIGATATLSLDLDAYLSSGAGSLPNGQQAGRIGANAYLRADQVDRIGASAVVEDYNYEIDTAVKGVRGTQPYLAAPPPSGGGDPTAGLMPATGVRSSALEPAFTSGQARIVSGSGITATTPRDGALVEQRFATANHLRVGSRFWLHTGDIGAAHPTDLQVTVVGIYRDQASSRPGQYTPSLSEPGDKLYLAPSAAAALTGGRSATATGQPTSNSATFRLHSPADVAALRAAAQAAGVNLAWFPISLNDKLYRQLTGPVSKTATVARYATWLIVVAGVAVLVLLLASTVRDRRRELGVLLSLGERKPRIVGQLLVELSACALIGLAASGVAAQFVGRWIGDALLSGQVSSTSAVAKAPDHSAVNGTPSDTPRPVSSLRISLRAADVGTVGALGAGLVIAGIALPASGILRLQPRAVLARGE